MSSNPIHSHVCVTTPGTTSQAFAPLMAIALALSCVFHLSPEPLRSPTSHSFMISVSANCHIVTRWRHSHRSVQSPQCLELTGENVRTFDPTSRLHPDSSLLLPLLIFLVPFPIRYNVARSLQCWSLKNKKKQKKPQKYYKNMFSF